VTDLEARLARAFPNLRVAPLRELATGFHSVAVETAHGVVFRIPRQEGTANGHALESRVLPLLAPRLPAPVPLPEWRIEPGHPDFPLGAIGYRKLPGHHPTPENLAENLALASQLADFLAALHAFPLDEAERLGLHAWLEPRESLLWHRDQVVPALEDLLEPGEYARVLRWWDAVLVGCELERFEPAVRHGDPWYGNVLVDESGRLAGVLDWEGLEIGDPAADLAAQVYLGPRFLRAVLDRYASSDPGFERRVELRAQQREFDGIRISLELGDDAELAESIRKLRAGPILG
jgi:aminoglycoside phosphotransferase (APT) family kinase protein